MARMTSTSVKAPAMPVLRGNTAPIALPLIAGLASLLIVAQPAFIYLPFSKVT